MISEKQITQEQILNVNIQKIESSYGVPFEIFEAFLRTISTITDQSGYYGHFEHKYGMTLKFIFKIETSILFHRFCSWSHLLFCIKIKLKFGLAFIFYFHLFYFFLFNVLHQHSSNISFFEFSPSDYSFPFMQNTKSYFGWINISSFPSQSNAMGF